MEAIQKAPDILRLAVTRNQVRDHVLDDVTVAIENPEDALREWNNL